MVALLHEDLTVLLLHSGKTLPCGCCVAVESFKEIQDSVCVSQRSSDGLEERVVLFLKMSPGITLGADLIKAIKMQIRTYLSARHVPAIFLPIGDIPVSDIDVFGRHIWFVFMCRFH